MAEEDYDVLQDLSEIEKHLPNLTLDDKPIDDDFDNSGLPFNSIYKDPVKFKSLHRNIFIPGQPVAVKIINHERNVTNLLNPYLYTIQFTHGNYTWTVCKRYKHIEHLHRQLKLFRGKLKLALPFQRSESNEEVKEETKGPLPRFPNKQEVLIGLDQIEERIEQLEAYLGSLLQVKAYRNHHETASFLTVSNVSFVNELGIKGLEGMVQKRTGSTRKGGCNFCGLLDHAVCSSCALMCNDICGGWRNRWLFVKDTFLGYIRPRDGSLHGVILFDQFFEVSSGTYTSGMSSRFQIINMNRRVLFKCPGKRKKQEWCNHLRDVAARQGYGFTKPNKNSSFAPVRDDTWSCWFVDGASFMAAVADAINEAKEEIFIADWWLSPEIYLKRPYRDSHIWRLDMLLVKKAEEGVKIFVMLYKEVELALGINSYYSKSRLSSLHKNIKVLRHPDHANSGVFLWAHHEKIVCIDQTHAFVGGIDLCYGRWDDHNHRLADLGEIHNSALSLPRVAYLNSSSPVGSKQSSLLKLAQSTNLVTMGALAASKSDMSGIDEVDEPDMESSVAGVDVELSKVSNGDVENHIVRGTISENDENRNSADEIIQPSAENIKCNTPEMERKPMLLKFKESMRNTSRSIMQRITNDDDEESGYSMDSILEASKENLPDVTETAVLQEVAVPVENVGTPIDDIAPGDCNTKFWVGKDYANFIVKDLCSLDSPYQDLVDRGSCPRMPWHDIGVMVHGAAARDVARHFIQRWNAIKLEKAKKMQQYPYLMPKSYEHFEEPLTVNGQNQYKVKCQVLRSASSWSAGFLDQEFWEQSIHEAYVNLIDMSEHYIYIENQFFISLAQLNNNVMNQISQALVKRILKAHREGKAFRVIVIMPLLPGFEGEIGAPSGTAIHAVSHWNYASISRGNSSVLTRLKENGIEDPSKYISFHGLRKHATLQVQLVTELIYVHSKLMIVDDKYVICGSANINDRSLLGKRDSEVAVLLQDEELFESRMNHEPYLVGKYASSLRKYIFGEHLGLLPCNSFPSFNTEVDDIVDGIDLTDPVCDEFYVDQWLAISKNNTELFEKVFKCLPTDKVKSFKELKEYQSEIKLCQSQPAIAAHELKGVKGHLVDLPLDFLVNEILTPNPNSMEGIAPTSLWT